MATVLNGISFGNCCEYKHNIRINKYTKCVPSVRQTKNQTTTRMPFSIANGLNMISKIPYGKQSSALPLHLFPFYPRDELSSVPSTCTSCLASRSEIHSRLCSYNGGTVRASILFHPLNAVFFFAGAMRCFYGSTDRFCTEYKLCSSSWCQICQRKAIDTFDSEWEKDAWTHLNIW